MGLVEALEMDCVCVPRIATGFGAGLGRTGDICGAMSGAVMALSLGFGRDNPDDVDAKEMTYAKAALLMNAFKNEFANLRCRDLIGCDLSTPEGRADAERKKVHTEICPRFVAFAAGEAWRLMQE